VPRIAVALHGIEPATFERCALIRDWLDDHGVDRVTLLVIPARDLHPIAGRSPEMVGWLAERRLAGDSIAQHGFQHVPLRAGSSAGRLLRMAHGRRTGEFIGLDGEETRRAVHAGWRVLKLAGVEPDGFVAPSYAYTSALRRTLGLKFQWWADLMRVHSTAQPETGPSPPRVRAWSFGGGGPLSRAFSPQLLRAGSLLSGETLRLDLHPCDLEHTRHMLALEWVLMRNGMRRRAITYRELAGAVERMRELPVPGETRRVRSVSD
jgi:predicted deacetylase